jgi:hypothetical protein
MVLVELVELIVNVDWTINSVCDRVNVDLAYLSCLEFGVTHLIVPDLPFLNLIVHHFDSNAYCHKDNPKNSELKHRAQHCWHRTPSWKSLLLEL